MFYRTRVNADACFTFQEQGFFTFFALMTLTLIFIYELDQ